jgi:histidine ammonia-lyase
MDHVARRDKSAFSESARELHNAVREVAPKLNADRSLSNEIGLLAKRVLSKDPPGANTVWMV